MLTRHWMRWCIAEHWPVDRQRVGKTVSYRNGIDKNESSAETTLPDAGRIKAPRPSRCLPPSREFRATTACGRVWGIGALCHGGDVWSHGAGAVETGSFGYP